MIRRRKISERYKNIDGVNDGFRSSQSVIYRTLLTNRLNRLSLCLLISLGCFAVQSHGYSQHPLQNKFPVETTEDVYSYNSNGNIKVISGGPYALDENTGDRGKKKEVVFSGGYLEGSNNAEQHFFTYDLSILSSIKSKSYQNNKTIVSTVSGSDKNNKGGTFNFLQNNILISSEFHIEEGKVNFSSGNGLSTTAIELNYGGSVRFLDSSDFSEEYKDDSGQNGAGSVTISAKADFSYSHDSDEHLLKNDGYSTYAVKNTLSNFLLHSNEFKIISQNSALSAYDAKNDANGTANSGSSIAVGIFSQGGTFNFKSQKGNISSLSTESAFGDQNPKANIVNNTSEGNFHKFEKAAFFYPPSASEPTPPASAPIRC